MNVEANNNDGATGGNRKYPNEHGYVADQGISLFDGDAFDELADDRIDRYNRRHAALATQDYTAYGYAMITPVDVLIKIMRQVDKEAPNLKPNMYFPHMTPVELEGSRYGKLLAKHQDKEREQHLDGLALQASTSVMQSSNPADFLTKFIQKTEARVFAYMNTAPAQELHHNYGVPADGRPDL